MNQLVKLFAPAMIKENREVVETIFFECHDILQETIVVEGYQLVKIFAPTVMKER
jgi:hypothetical protein